MISVRKGCLLALTSAVVTLITVGFSFYLLSRYDFSHLSVVVVDSDGGVDDLFALLMLLRAENVLVKAITTVSGNTGVVNATRNIRTLLSMLNKHSIPVYPGRKRPVPDVEGYYGWDGFGDFLPPVHYTESEYQPNAGEMLARMVAQHPGEITLLNLGPLTNLAEALKCQPDLLNLVKSTYIVGASYKGGGNVGPGLEFNMASAPTAASFVFQMASYKNPVQVIPLETIESFASFPRSWREKLGELGTEMVELFNKAEKKSLQKDDLWTCYDQTGAAAVITPGIVVNREQGRLSLDTYGAAIFTPTSDNASVHMITSLRKPLLEFLLVEALSSF